MMLLLLLLLVEQELPILVLDYTSVGTVRKYGKPLLILTSFSFLFLFFFSPARLVYWIVRCIFLVSSSMARNLKRSHSFSYVCANIERDLIYSSSYQKKQFFLKCTLSVFHRLLLLFQSKAKNISFRRRTDKTTTIASFLPSMKFHVKYEIILDIFIWLEEKVQRHRKHTHERL